MTANPIAIYPANGVPENISANTVTAEGLYVSSLTQGPYVQFFDDLFNMANITTGSIGAQTGGNVIQILPLDAMHVGQMELVSGTVNAAGVTATIGASSNVVGFNSAPAYLWETLVDITVLPGTTPASYQIGCAAAINVSPYVDAPFSFYLSSANANVNNWYTGYHGTAGMVFTDSTVAAVAGAFTRLTVTMDGTDLNFFINGVLVQSVAISLMNTTAPGRVFTASCVAGSTTSVTMRIDYVTFQRNVTR